MNLIFFILTLLSLVGLFRLGHLMGIFATRTGRCERCGHSGVVVGVFYGKNTGLMVLRQTSTLSATLCRGCSLSEGAKMTAHTAVLGWWGVISCCLTVVILPGNLAQMMWAAGLPGAAHQAKKALSVHREWAAALLATKDRNTVVEVLVKETNAAPVEVHRFLESLEVR